MFFLKPNHYNDQAHQEGQDLMCSAFIVDFFFQLNSSGECHISDNLSTTFWSSRKDTHKPGEQSREIQPPPLYIIPIQYLKQPLKTPNEKCWGHFSMWLGRPRNGLKSWSDSHEPVLGLMDVCPSNSTTAITWSLVLMIHFLSRIASPTHYSQKHDETCFVPIQIIDYDLVDIYI